MLRFRVWSGRGRGGGGRGGGERSQAAEHVRYVKLPQFTLPETPPALVRPSLPLSHRRFFSLPLPRFLSHMLMDSELGEWAIVRQSYRPALFVLALRVNVHLLFSAREAN